MLFDRTVRKELARGFGATLVVVLTIVLTMFLIRTVGQAASGLVAPQDVVLLMGYVALGHLPTMLSLSLFVAVVVSLGRMYRDSEMAVWFSSGVGLSRFVRPVLRTAWPVLVVTALLLVFVWPWGNRANLELRARYAGRSDLARITPGVFQKSADGQRVLFVERESADGVNARNVFVVSNAERGESVLSAHRGRQDTVDGVSQLVLEEGQSNVVDARSGERTLASFHTYRVVVGEKGAAPAGAALPRAQSTLQLLRSRSSAAAAELAWRFGLLAGTFNLLLLGIGLAATHPRRAANWNLLLAVLVFFVYYNLINLSQAWVAGGVPMAAAMVTVHGGAFALGLLLLWWRDRAAVLPHPRTWLARRTSAMRGARVAA